MCPDCRRLLHVRAPYLRPVSASAPNLCIQHPAPYLCVQFLRPTPSAFTLGLPPRQVSASILSPQSPSNLCARPLHSTSTPYRRVQLLHPPPASGLHAQSPRPVFRPTSASNLPSVRTSVRLPEVRSERSSPADRWQRPSSSTAVTANTATTVTGRPSGHTQPEHTGTTAGQPRKAAAEAILGPASPSLNPDKKNPPDRSVERIFLI